MLTLRHASLACSLLVVSLALGNYSRAQTTMEFDMNPAVKAVLSESSIKELQAAIDPLHTVTTVLTASPRATPEKIAQALSLAHATLDAIESRSLQIQPDDPLALFWTNALSDGWFVTGWAAIESGDLNSAESYLRASWQLSHDRSSGMQLARVLMAKGDKTGAAHLLELASVARIDNPMGLMGSNFPMVDDVAESYTELTGKALPTAGPDSKDKIKTLQKELDEDGTVGAIHNSGTLSGIALFLATLETGADSKASWYADDEVLASLAPKVGALTFKPTFPKGSSARIVREVRVVCASPSGCNGFLQAPWNIEVEGSRVDMKKFAPNSTIHYATVQVRLE